MPTILSFTFLCHKWINSVKVKLKECLSSVHVWFCFNGLAIKPKKSEAIVFGWCNACVLSLPIPPVTLMAAQFCHQKLSKHLTLGVTLVRYLTFQPLLISLCKSCFYNIRAIYHIECSYQIAYMSHVWPALVSIVPTRFLTGISDLRVNGLQCIIWLAWCCVHIFIQTPWHCSVSCSGLM